MSHYVLNFRVFLAETYAARFGGMNNGFCNAVGEMLFEAGSVTVPRRWSGSAI